MVAQRVSAVLASFSNGQMTKTRVRITEMIGVVVVLAEEEVGEVAEEEVVEVGEEEVVEIGEDHQLEEAEDGEEVEVQELLENRELLLVPKENAEFVELKVNNFSILKTNILHSHSFIYKY